MEFKPQGQLEYLLPKQDERNVFGYSPEERESFKIHSQNAKATDLNGYWAKSSRDISIRSDGDYFIFPDIQYAPGLIGDIAITKKCLENGAIKTHVGWKQYSLENSNGIVVPNSQIIYQIMHRLYELRNDINSKKIVEMCVRGLRNDSEEFSLKTETKIIFGFGLETTVEHLQLDKSVQSINVEIPEFVRHNNKWAYLSLANEQPESELGNVEPIPDKAKPVLEALLGKGYEELGAVCQYIASRKNSLLREVRLWVPTANDRNTVRALAFGGDYNVGFGIGAYDYVNDDGSARGVVLQKSLTGSRG